jgi:hypothetical protein
VVVFGEDDAEDGILGLVDQVDNEMCFFSLLFDSNQRSAHGTGPSNAWSSARRSTFSISFPDLCGGP